MTNSAPWSKPINASILCSPVAVTRTCEASFCTADDSPDYRNVLDILEYARADFLRPAGATDMTFRLKLKKWKGRTTTTTTTTMWKVVVRERRSGDRVVARMKQGNLRGAKTTRGKEQREWERERGGENVPVTRIRRARGHNLWTSSPSNALGVRIPVPWSVSRLFLLLLSLLSFSTFSTSLFHFFAFPCPFSSCSRCSHGMNLYFNSIYVSIPAWIWRSNNSTCTRRTNFSVLKGCHIWKRC